MIAMTGMRRFKFYITLNFSGCCTIPSLFSVIIHVVIL